MLCISITLKCTRIMYLAAWVQFIVIFQSFIIENNVNNEKRCYIHNLQHHNIKHKPKRFGWNKKYKTFARAMKWFPLFLHSHHSKTIILLPYSMIEDHKLFPGIIITSKCVIIITPSTTYNLMEKNGIQFHSLGEKWSGYAFHYWPRPAHLPLTTRECESHSKKKKEKKRNEKRTAKHPKHFKHTQSTNRKYKNDGIWITSRK